jgi:hypothetical protein
MDASTASKLTGVTEPPWRRRSRNVAGLAPRLSGPPGAKLSHESNDVDTADLAVREDGVGRRDRHGPGGAVGIGAAHALDGLWEADQPTGRRAGSKGPPVWVDTGGLTGQVATGHVSGPVICVTENGRDSRPVWRISSTTPGIWTGFGLTGNAPQVLAWMRIYLPARQKGSTRTSAGRGSRTSTTRGQHDHKSRI